MKLTIDFGNPFDKKKLFEILKSRKATKYTVEIKAIVPKRSLNANKYYWACLGIISAETGNDSEDLHYHFKSKFLGTKDVVFKETGEVGSVPKSSADLEQNIFCDYIESIRQFSLVDLNIYLPTPEEYLANF